MATVEVQITPPDLIRRMEQYPDVLDKEMRQAHNGALTALQREIPPYPPKPAGSTYIRTEKLGRGLGSGFSGGQVGLPSIRNVRKLGQGVYESEIGSNTPHYNHYVIGERTQAYMHKGRWWTVKDWGIKAIDRVIGVFEAMTKRMASYLDGK